MCLFPVKHRAFSFRGRCLTISSLYHKESRNGVAKDWFSPRKELSLFQLTEMFPDEDAARQWFEALRWEDGRFCPHWFLFRDGPSAT